MKFFFEFFRWFGLITGYPVHAICFRKKVYYENRKIQGRRVRGGALIISNHYSVLDYVYNIFLFPFRKLFVIFADFGWWARFGMRFFGGIPVNRSSYHMPFIKTSVDLLKKGRIVQIYPEAHISKDGNMLPFKPSYIHIALGAGVPIIPVILDGNYGFFKREHLIIGTPINVSEYCENPERPTREEIRKINEDIQKKCHELKADLDARVQSRTKNESKE